MIAFIDELLLQETAFENMLEILPHYGERIAYIEGQTRLKHLNSIIMSLRPPRQADDIQTGR